MSCLTCLQYCALSRVAHGLPMFAAPAKDARQGTARRQTVLALQAAGYVVPADAAGTVAVTPAGRAALQDWYSLTFGT